MYELRQIKVASPFVHTHQRNITQGTGTENFELHEEKHKFGNSFLLGFNMLT
jgi:hypothetical protein